MSLFNHKVVPCILIRGEGNEADVLCNLRKYADGIFHASTKKFWASFGISVAFFPPLWSGPFAFSVPFSLSENGEANTILAAASH